MASFTGGVGNEKNAGFECNNPNNECDREENNMGSYIRGVLARFPPTGRIESIDLEYIEGISLKEWIIKLNQKRQSSSTVDENMKHDLLERVKIAHAVAKSVAEVHELGLVHNDVTLSNFIVLDEKALARENEGLKAEGHLTEDSLNTLINMDVDDKALNTPSYDANMGMEEDSQNQEQHFLDDCGYRVKIIDFGYATMQSSMETADCGQTVNDDIPALAEVIRSLFSDSTSFGDEEEDNDFGFGIGFGLTGGLSTPSHQQYTQLPDLPPPILTILQDLPASTVTTSSLNVTDTGLNDSSTQFQSVREVELDFAQILEDPDHFLFFNTSTNRRSSFQLMSESLQEGVKCQEEEEIKRDDVLYFSSTKLRGRDAESAALLDACKHQLGTIDSSSTNSNSENISVHLGSITSVESLTKESTKFGKCILVSGRSGVGKTELVRRVLRPWVMKDCQGYFVQGKFDQLQNARPYSAFRRAFGDLCELIVERGENTVSNVSKRILSAVGGSVGTVASEVIPNLTKIIGPQPADSTELTGYERQKRFDYVLRKLISAISLPEHPVVIFLDDLQWADEASLHLMRSLVLRSSALIVGSYREDEVSPDSLFGRILSEGEKMNVAQIQ
eukprot:15349978-Ditylum_brightwellii.AAC.1